MKTYIMQSLESGHWCLLWQQGKGVQETTDVLWGNIVQTLVITEAPRPSMATCVCLLLET